MDSFKRFSNMLQSPVLAIFPYRQQQLVAGSELAASVPGGPACPLGAGVSVLTAFPALVLAWRQQPHDSAAQPWAAAAADLDGQAAPSPRAPGPPGSRARTQHRAAPPTPTSCSCS